MRSAFLTLASVAALAACIDRPVKVVKPVLQSGVSETVENDSVDKVDLLVMVDNSGSMAQNQSQIFGQLEPLINTLTTPKCVNSANMTPHTCDPNNAADKPEYPPVKDLHVGIVSSDLGTRGDRPVIGCEVPDKGDDGLLNPIRFGPATQVNPPRQRAAGMNFFPADCLPIEQYGSFLEFRSDTTPPTNPTTFSRDFKCNAGLYKNGCGLEQQLEAIHRSLITQDASSEPGNTSPNANFLRRDALLAILVLSDEEDGSVRDCRYADDPVACMNNNDDAGDVFDTRPPSMGGPPQYTTVDPNLRFYLYKPGNFVSSPNYDPTVGADPNWPLDRYYNPRDPHKGWLSLKCPPGATGSACKPERVVFAAITGVPINVPVVAGSQNTDWSKLLGTSNGDPNDFYGRDPAGAIDEMSSEGPISMRPNNPDTTCNGQRTVPACRRRGTPFMNQCNATQQYFAWPSRRIVEIARRFDETPLCGGGSQPCNNGLVTSICDTDYTTAMQTIIKKIQSRLAATCFKRPLATANNEAMTERRVDCLVRVTMPEGATCDPSKGYRDPAADGSEGTKTVTEGGVTRPVCVVEQVPTATTTPFDPITTTVPNGWFYDQRPSALSTGCSQQISFTSAAQPPPGSSTRLECIQNAASGGDAGTTPTDSGARD